MSPMVNALSWRKGISKAAMAAKISCPPAALDYEEALKEPSAAADCFLFPGLRASLLFLRPRPSCRETIPGRLEQFWIVDAVEKQEPEISKRAMCEIAIVFRQRWSAGSSRRRNHARKLKGVHAAACQGFMRKLH